MRRPARHSPTASAASTPVTVNDTPPGAGSGQGPSHTRSTCKRTRAPLSVRAASAARVPSTTNGVSLRCASRPSIANPPRRCSSRLRSGGCCVASSAADASSAHPATSPVNPLPSAHARRWRDADQKVAMAVTASSHRANGIHDGSANTPTAVPAAAAIARASESDMPLSQANGGASGKRRKTQKGRSEHAENVTLRRGRRGVSCPRQRRHLLQEPATAA